MIRIFDYRRLLKDLEKDVMKAIRRVLHSNHLILGPETLSFEKEFAKKIGVKHCIAVSSGTAALYLALKALNIGPKDAVIIPPNTCVPTASAVRLTGGDVRFVDAEEDSLSMDLSKLESAITSRTRCIIPVHLWGKPVSLTALKRISKKYDIPFVEDCAHAQGSFFKNIHVGGWGACGCFSFYPTKNLGAYGDAGAVVTQCDELADKLRALRTYGYNARRIAMSDGFNFRPQEIQMAVLRIKLKYLNQWIARRRKIASYYIRNISNPNIRIPETGPLSEHAFHQFVIRVQNRQQLIGHLTQSGVESGIHYPVPLHQMPAFQSRVRLPVAEKASQEILSIPVHESLTDDQTERIVECLNAYEG